jgi:hypothetical protein
MPLNHTYCHQHAGEGYHPIQNWIQPPAKDKANGEQQYHNQQQCGDKISPTVSSDKTSQNYQTDRNGPGRPLQMPYQQRYSDHKRRESNPVER